MNEDWGRFSLMNAAEYSPVKIHYKTLPTEAYVIFSLTICFSLQICHLNIYLLCRELFAQRGTNKKRNKRHHRYFYFHSSLNFEAREEVSKFLHYFQKSLLALK